MPSLFQAHIAEWSACERCHLCEQRNKVVLFRGKIPCDALFIGEAPGPSEDVIGQPFVGPAGNLLQEAIDRATGLAEADSLRIGFSNLVACIPKGDDSAKFQEPDADSIAACSPRLNELVNLCKPSLIVLVGKLAKKYISGQAQFGPLWISGDRVIEFVEILHPAAILRADVSQRSLLVKRMVATLEDAFTMTAKKSPNA